MKIIDLFYKIANGEELPKKIKYYGDIFILDERERFYKAEKNYEYTLVDALSGYKEFNLNEEVEIIEEDKKIEKLRQLCEYPSTDTYECWSIKEDILVNKFNEIIDYINKMEKDK